MEGVNNPLFTWSPEKIPPAGIAVKEIAGSSLQTPVIGVITGFGKGFTVIVIDLSAGQLPLV